MRRKNRNERRNVIFQTLICIVFLSSCDDNKSVIVKDIIKGNDTIVHRQEFDLKGTLILDESFRKDSSKEGYYYVQHSDGSVLSGNFNNGKKDGIWYTILSGDTIKKENWLEGQLFGEQIVYYHPSVTTQRSAVYQYFFVGGLGDSVFEMFYDRNGQVAKIKGAPVFLTYTADKISIGEEYFLVLFWSTPTDFTYDVHIYEINTDGKIINRHRYLTGTDTSSVSLRYSRRAEIIKKYSQSGVYRWAVNYEAKNLDNELIRYADTVVLVVR